MISEALIRNQINRITFVMVDITLTEVTGLGAGFVLEVSKNGGAFNPGTGVLFGEISDGWYYYDLTAAECDTIGPLSVIVNGAGCIQQNLEYVVQQRTAGCRSFTYVVTNTVTLLPMAGVEVWFSTDFVVPPANVVWYGVTDVFGVARDTNGNVPCLDDGVYAAWKVQPGYTPDFWPDSEVVGP